MRDPNNLHPLLEIKVFPRWDKQGDEFFGFREDIRLNGIRHPLQITASNGVIDGETRRQGALSLQMPEVPCVVVPESEVNTVIIRELVRRRNLTKGQRAYLSFKFLMPAIDEARGRAFQNLKKGQQISVADSIGDGKTIDVFAKQLGFSGDLLEQAEWLHRTFEKSPVLRKEWEPKILDMDSPIGLGAAKAGIAGAKADQSLRDMGCLQNAFSGFRRQCELWDDLTAGEREKLKTNWRDAVSELPGSMRKAMKEVL